MHKKFFIFLGLIIGLLCLSSQGISGDTQNTICAPLGSMILKPPSSVEAKGPVKFSHTEHMVLFSCKTCHHTWDGGEKISNCTTSDCHGTEKPPRSARRKGVTWLDFSEEQIKYYKNAYHRQCISCHKQIKLKNIALMEESKSPSELDLEDTGPTACRYCHQEK